VELTILCSELWSVLSRLIEKHLFAFGWISSSVLSAACTYSIHVSIVCSVCVLPVCHVISCIKEPVSTSAEY